MTLVNPGWITLNNVNLGVDQPMPATSEELRARIQRTKPWEKTRGATTELGRLIVSANSLKNGLRSKNALIREAARHARRLKLAEAELEDFKRLVVPFALCRRPLPPVFIQTIRYLNLDPEEFCEQIRIGVTEQSQPSE
ncbi:hypothetical protein [Leptolyngbya sp. DQ-M1]|uniref:hypothetical protein n=1 Tax=Leptolyngbya sp. DQ-M1 TaxID=2933920 RepID=UPI0032984C71